MIRPLSVQPRSLHDLARLLGAQLPDGADVLLTGATHSSSEVEPGDLFIAIPGAVTHGAKFAEDARNRGAVALLTDLDGAQFFDGLPTVIVQDVRSAAGIAASWIYGEPMHSLAAVGITGTNGKTTVTYLIHQLLTAAGRESGLIGTVETRIGHERVASSRTTPEAAQLQSLAATMKERHLRHCVMEVSSHSIALKRIKGGHFSVLGFTNLSQDHLDFHPTMADYFQAKAALFTQEYGDIAFINIDDSYGQTLCNQTELPVIKLSQESTAADWHYTRIERIGSKTSIAIRGRFGILIESSTALQGSYNLDNLLMAVAIVEYLGIDPLEIATLIPELKGAPGRLEAIELGQPFSAFVDYAHSPDAVKNVLQTVREITPGKIIAILGCGGDRDRSKRPLMGRALVDGSDIAIFTSDNPRNEHPADILADMTAGLEVVAPSAVIEDRRGAIHHAVSLAQPGDTVLLLGKGHEQGQEIKGVVSPFDDRHELALAIEVKP